MISAHASVFGGMDVQRLCHQKTQDTKATNNQLSSSSHSPPKVFVLGVRNAGHLLMLENYQEFNAAMAVASGREGDLPPGMPRSVEFICDEGALRLLPIRVVVVPTKFHSEAAVERLS